MSSRTIVAIGGSGTHAVIAFLRLAILSNMDVVQVPNVIVIDGDVAPGGKDGNNVTPSLLDAARNLHAQVVEGCQENTRPYFRHFTPYKGENQQVQVVQANTPFGDYLIGQPVTTAKPDDKLILDALFTRHRQNDDRKSEQKILISSGFFARPSVGSTAIYDLLNQPQSALQHTLAQHLGTGSSFIAVVGSSTGGTGSGGGPAIAQWLVSERKQRKSQAKIALFMTLPWFHSKEKEPDDSSGKEATYGDKRTQQLNAAAGVRLYAESETLPDAGVFLADFNGDWHKRENDGNYGQPEYPHVFNLMIASQIQNFLIAAERGDNNGVVGTYSFFHPTESGSTKLTINAADSPLIAFSANKNQRQDIEDWANETQSIRLILEKLATFIELGYRVAPAAQMQDRKELFAALMLDLARKLGPEENTTESVGGWLGMAKKQRENEDVRKELAKSLRNRSKSLQATIAWLNKLWKNSQESDSGETTFSISNSAIEKQLDSNSKIHENYPIFKKGSDPFITVLRVFEDAFDSKINSDSIRPADGVMQQFNYLIASDGGGLLPVEAATTVIEAQIRALIQKQFGGGGRRVRDHEGWVAGQRSATPLLPMRIKVTPVNSYLVNFEIGKLVDEAEDRQGKMKTPADPTHPFTISDLASANIPSPWAAARLQSWLQLHGDSNQIDSAVQHFESIMWGVFTKHLLPVSIPLRGNRLGKLLTRSLDAELKSQALRDLDTLLVACDATNPADVVAVNHPLVGWYLAPWLAEEATTQQTPWWKLPRFNLELPTDIIGKHASDKNSFSMRQVRSFVDYLQQLVVNHQPDTVGIRHIPWHGAVRKLVQRLEGAVVGVLPIKVDKVPGHALCLWGRQETGSRADYDLRSTELVLLARSAIDIFNSYLPNHLVLLDNKSGGPIYPASPVLPEHIGKVRATFRELKQTASSEYGPYQVKYSLEIDELGTYDVVIPAVVRPFFTHIAIWPNFKEEDWNYYYIGCDPGDALRVRDDIRFSLYDAEGKLLGGKAHRSFRTNHEVEGVPAFLGIETVEGDVIVSRGLYEVRLDEVHGASSIFRLGIDIGTSHSSFYAIDGNGSRIPGLDFSNAAVLGRTIFDYPLGAARAQDELLFLGLFSAREQHNNQSVIPSELRVQKREGEPVRAEMLSDEPDPGKHFSTTPLAFKTQAAATRGRGDEILSDFKWRVQRNWAGKATNALVGTPFQAQQETVLRLYMRQFFRIGFALLRKQGFKTLDVFRASYPEAFEDLMIENYAKVLVEVMQEMPRSTGIQLTLSKPLTKENLLAYRNNPDTGASDADSFLLSESLAAFGANSDGVASPLMVPGVCLVLDMGGGTTDVALYVTAQKGTDPIKVASLTDSIRYAGNDILGLLASPPVLSVLVQATDPNVKDADIAKMTDADRMLTLKRTIRDVNAVQALRLAFANGELPSKISIAIELFFQGLIDYSSLLLKPYLHKFDTEKKKITVSVVLLGNGWYLSDLIWHEGGDPASGFMKEMTKQLDKQIGKLGRVDVKYKTTGVQVSVKESIAMGAANFMPRAALVAKMNPRLSVPGFPLDLHIDGQILSINAGGFMELACKPRQLVNAIEIGAIDILPLEMRRNLARVLKVDEADLADRLQNALKAHIEQFINLRLQTQNPIRISPLAIFLEGLWKEVVVQTAQGEGS